MDYDDPDACKDDNCVWLFPHKRDERCLSLPVTLNDDDDPSLIMGA